MVCVQDYSERKNVFPMHVCALSRACVCVCITLRNVKYCKLMESEEHATNEDNVKRRPCVH